MKNNWHKQQKSLTAAVINKGCMQPALKAAVSKSSFKSVFQAALSNRCKWPQFNG
ncbi:hypothetical protein [Anaerobiospirillum sp. NML120511]|uniref:hypothetical protein n=1 Tax=Anaerobiospirillum sp. NML120511 TaxID=2932819 RepID=UPI001FF5D2B9|nr:hypothetical protein [Anaerobiospirillum sp. NML120511]MCK0535525.1 hypothetical protein [Anaerobiospirillum sp. NML120511]